MRSVWLRACLTGAALTALLTLNAAAAPIGTGCVNADALNLRSEPSTQSTSLGLISSGATIDVLEDAVDGWYKVSCLGKTGYVSADYLEVNWSAGESTAEVAAAAALAPQEEDLGNGKVTLSSGTLNLRVEPNTDSNRLASIPNGTVLALESKTQDGWYKVTYAGQSGYVRGDYIVPTGEAAKTEQNADAAASATGLAVVAKAKQYLGRPYVYGGSGPNAFDCSGFTSYVYKQFGYRISHGASSQMKSSGSSVDKSNLQPGDLVFFRDFSCKNPASHVGIYIGGGQFIHASSSKRSGGVKISSLSESWYAARYVGARRVLSK